MKHLALIGVIALTSCAAKDNLITVYAYTNDQTAADTKVTLLASENLLMSFEDLNKLYIETEACMGMIADGPTVRFVDFYTFFGYIGGWGLYAASDGGHVFINTYATKMPLGIERTAKTDIETAKHEFVHHILKKNTGDMKHSNPMFERCGLGPNTYN
jgi:hypothetical protein